MLTFPRVSATLALLIPVTFAACGGTIAIESGSGSGVSSSRSASSTAVSSSSTGLGGAPGFGGSPSLDAAVSTVASSSSSGGVGGAGGAGGGSPCDMACAHVEACFGITCGVVGINCATLGSGFDCVAECINDTPCANLSQGTLTTCQAQCADGGTPPIDAGTDGSTSAGCEACVGSSCLTALKQCEGDATCKSWVGCAEACFNQPAAGPSCFSACDAQYPGAANLYAPVYSCVCQSCNSQCADVNACAAGTDGGP